MNHRYLLEACSVRASMRPLIFSVIFLGLVMNNLAFSQGFGPLPQISLAPWASGLQRPVVTAEYPEKINPAPTRRRISKRAKGSDRLSR